MLVPPRTLRRVALASVLAVAATMTVAVAASRPDVRPGRAVPPDAPPAAITADGRITDMLRMGDRIYVRGDFTTIGPYAGSGMPLDPATGERVSAPPVDGQISVSVPDGNGGWYVGGDFRRIGDVETHGLAHLGPDGTPDPTFTHQLDGLVSALDLADGTLWLGGDFTAVDETARRRLAAIDVGTGQLTAFSSPQNTRVSELVHADAAGGRPARVYVGTDRVQALDPETGAVDDTFASDLAGNVRALLVDGDRVLVGGRGLAALDADTGAVDTSFGLPGERFPAQGGGVVHTLLRSGDALYAGGDFDSLGGGTAALVALDPVTGLADPAFTPAIDEVGTSYGDGGVFDLAMAGESLWVGGALTSVAGQPAGNLVALDPATGERRELAVPAYDHAVNAVDASGDGLYVGGQFYMTGAVRAPGFAALDATTLLPISTFTPQRNLGGSMLAGDGVLYTATTNFEGYDSGPGNPYYSWTERIRAIDPESGATLPALSLRSVENLSGVTTLGDHLYVGQRLENDERFPRTRISVYSQNTGELVRRFRLPQRGYVAELSSVGDNLLAVGSFRRWREGGQPAHLAAMEVDPGTGELRSGFDLHTHGPIYDVENRDGDLYVAGMFDSVNTGMREVDRRGIAAFERSGDGYATLVRGFEPPRNLQGSYYTRLVGLTGSVVVLAWRTTFLDPDTGAKLPDPTGGYAPTIDSVVPDPDGVVYSATIPVPIAGQGRYYLSFVARAG